MTAFRDWSDDMEFRKADIIDKEQLIELRMAYIAEDMGKVTPDTEKQMRTQLADYFDRRLNRELFAYIAEEGEAAVSSCMLLVTEKPANPRFPHGLTGTVLNVYTKPDHRRQGLAERLMKMLIKDAVDLGLDFIELKSTADALKLYKSLGFEQSFSKYTDMKLVF